LESITAKKGTIILKKDTDALKVLYLQSGVVTATRKSVSFDIDKGNFVGVVELAKNQYSFDYVAKTDCTFLEYDIAITKNDQLLESRKDISILLFRSIVKQLEIVMSFSARKESLIENIATTMQGLDFTVDQIKQKYNLNMNIGNPEVPLYDGVEGDSWLMTFYKGLLEEFSKKNFLLVLRDSSGIISGLTRKAELDAKRSLEVIESQEKFFADFETALGVPANYNYFEVCNAIVANIGIESTLGMELYDRIISFSEFLSEAGINYGFADRLNQMLKKKGNDSENELDVSILGNSLEVILGFSGLESETVSAIRDRVHKLRKVKDKNSSAEEIVRLRKQCAEDFNILFEAVFFATVKSENEIPLPIKLFMNFGYVDEVLAGERCKALLSIAKNLDKFGKNGIYTFYEWLLAIYNGKKAPSKNEFEEEYIDSIRKASGTGILPKDKELEAMNDGEAKVKWELANLFKAATKMTFGRITTFLPYFCEDNSDANLTGRFMSYEKILEILANLRTLDYTVFFRETTDVENAAILGNERVHVEIMPDIILTPVFGTRGAMWQEIEGKDRRSPARFVIPVMYEGAPDLLFVKLAGEFRWEMCKRMQGAYWNDASEHSLTSDYFQYAQFYRQNRELTTEAKEKIKIELQRSKNSFKEMFSRDYIHWIAYEIKGSSRLNKETRRIFFTYCPMTRVMESKLENNPQFTSLIEKKKIKLASQIHRLDNLEARIEKDGYDIPASLVQERLYLTGNKKEN